MNRNLKFNEIKIVDESHYIRKPEPVIRQAPDENMIL